jgi:protein FrlC
MPPMTRDQITGMNFHYMHYPFEYFLNAMARYEFRNIEIWGASPHLYIDDLSIRDMKNIKKEIDRRDLNVVCFTPEQCVYPINIAAKEDSLREKSLQYFIKSAEVAKELGAPMLLVTPGWGYENEDRIEAWKRSRDTIEKLTKVAEKLNIVLALEPLQRVESNLIYDSTSLKTMLHEVNSPFLKGMVDTIPMVLADEDFTDYFVALKEDLVHIHFIDGKPKGHLVWGDGILPLEMYLDQLSEADYMGYLTLEYTSRQYVQEPDLAIERTLKALSNFIL